MAIEGRKQAVSIRLSAADVRNLRKLSRRLGVRTSDVIRFAIKDTLVRLAPLCDAETTGRALVPVMVEAGADLMRYLDLDVTQLEAIINEGAAPVAQVERADVQLLAMSGLPRGYARLCLVRLENGRGQDGSSDEHRLDNSMQRYFYDKYVYAGSDAEPLASGGRS